MAQYYYCILFLLLFLPKLAFPAAFGFFNLVKIKPKSVSVPKQKLSDGELQKLFQNLVDELALALWEEPDCEKNLREPVEHFKMADPLDFHSSGQLRLLFGVTTTKANCIKYGQRESQSLVNLYKKLAPSSWTRKPGPKNWSDFFERMENKFVTPNCCKVQDRMRIEIGNKSELFLQYYKYLNSKNHRNL
jgi:hypothetical protein